MDDVWQPKRSNLEDIWVHCRELVECWFSKGCIHLEHAVAEKLNWIVHCFVIVKEIVLIHLNYNLIF